MQRPSDRSREYFPWIDALTLRLRAGVDGAAAAAGAASAGAASTAEASSAHIRVGGSDRKVACRAEHMPGMATRKGATPGESRRSRPT